MKNILVSALLLGGLMMVVPGEAAQRALLIGVGDYQRLPYNSQRLGLTHLREDFPTVQGPTRGIVVKGVQEQINQNIQAAASGGDRFEWSEATVVVRSHK